MNKLTLILLLGLVVVLRFLPHAPNVAPLTAFAIIVGLTFKSKWGVFVPLLASVVTDLVIGFHSAMFWVYTSYVVIYFVSLHTPKQKMLRILGTTLLASLLFFLITNFGVWVSGEMYEKSVSGFLACYTLALPFFRNSIVGDVFYTSLFVGLVKILPQIQTRLNLFCRPVIAGKQH